MHLKMTGHSFNQREKIAAYGFLAIFASILFFHVVSVPFLRKNATINHEIQITRLKLKQYLRLLNRKGLLLSQSANYLPSVIKEADSRATALDSILSELENLAGHANIRILDIRSDTARSDSSRKEIVVVLKTEGTMEGYLRFIYDSASSLSLLKIKTFRITARPNSALLEGDLSVSQGF